MSTPQYVEDLNGNLPANLIQNEEHVVSYDAGRGFHFITPKFGPFHVTDFKIFLVTPAGTQEWKEHINFYFGGKYQSLSFALAKPIWGMIVLPNLTATSTFRLQYRTVGGEHMVTEAEMLVNVANIVKNPRGLTWEYITGKPSYGRSVDHQIDYADVQGQTQVVETLAQLAANVLARAGQAMQIVDVRDLTRENFGLDKTPNFPVASLEQILGSDPTNFTNEAIMTPLLQYTLLDRLGLIGIVDTIKRFNAHIDTPGLGHSFSRRDLDLGDVPNLPLASDDEVLRGVPVEKLFTLRHMEMWLRLHGPSLNIGTTKHKAGTLLSSFCKPDTHRWQIVADGNGASLERIEKQFDPTCGAFIDLKIVYPAKGVPYKQYCTNGNLMNLVSNGDGTAIPEVAELSSRQCIGNVFAEAGTLLSSTCNGKTETRLIADGKGGVIPEIVENSAKCEANVRPAGEFIRNECSDDKTLTVYETNGTGGERVRSVTPKSPTCGYQEPTTPTNGNPTAGAVLGHRCENGSYIELIADGAGGNWPREDLSKKYLCPQPTSSTSTSTSTTTSRGTQPTVATLSWTTTHTTIYNGDTETQRVTGTGFQPNTLLTLRIMGDSTAWGEPYDRQLDTRQVRTDSSGNFTYRLDTTEVGKVPVGVYRSYWMVGDVRSNTITRSFMGNRW